MYDAAMKIECGLFTWLYFEALIQSSVLYQMSFAAVSVLNLSPSNELSSDHIKPACILKQDSKCMMLL